MRPLFQALVLLSVVLVAPASAQPPEKPDGAWLSPVALGVPGDPLSLVEPERLLVVVYSHGSRAEYRRDRCEPRGATTPPVVADLSGRRLGGLDVAVFAFCTSARLGDFDAESGRGEPKVVKRAREIADLAARLAGVGVPAKRIVLAGQSAGGWASLLAAADGTPAVGGVLAFAPAFAGPAGEREPAWQRLRDAQAQALAAAPAGPPALVYAFEGDRYEPPAHLDALAARPATLLLARRPCDGQQPHHGVFADCFAAVESGRLLAFLAQVVGAAGGA